MTTIGKADKLDAVADWFTDCKTLTLDKLPAGLIEALRDGATALRSIAALASLQAVIPEQERCGRDMGDGFTCVLWKGHQVGQTIPDVAGTEPRLTSLEEDLKWLNREIDFGYEAKLLSAVQSAYGTNGRDYVANAFANRKAK